MLSVEREPRAATLIRKLASAIARQREDGYAGGFTDAAVWSTILKPERLKDVLRHQSMSNRESRKVRLFGWEWYFTFGGAEDLIGAYTPESDGCLEMFIPEVAQEIESLTIELKMEEI